MTIPYCGTSSNNHVEDNNSNLYDWKYNPYIEYEVWYADHSFVAAMVCDFIKEHYAYKRRGYYGFGVSKLCNTVQKMNEG
mmetsp:Transcript_9802/g.11192  ORF Transcript_9802/g.11192 Transcript_9802/m.11192 type:complete len:80 (+) Transcript_9802:217-456(+)